MCPSVAGWLRAMSNVFPGTEQFCTVLQRGVSEAVNGSKEQFPASSFDGLPSFLEKALLGLSTAKAGQ